MHGEVERHELDDRPQARHGRADAEAREPLLGDGRIDYAPAAELLQQTLRDLVGALIFGDFLAHHEDPWVATHLLGHCIAECIADGCGLERGSLGDFGRVVSSRDIDNKIASA